MSISALPPSVGTSISPPSAAVVRLTGTCAVQVVAVALEDVVLLDADLDVQVARRPAVGARLAVAAGADAHAVVDAGGDLHLQRLGFLILPWPLQVVQGLGDDLAGAVAVRAGLLDAEEALAHLHRARPLQVPRAGLGAGAGLSAAAVAGVAGLPGEGCGSALLAVIGGLFERDFHRVADRSLPAVDLLAAAAAPPPPAAAEDVAEDVAERLGETAEAFAPGPPGPPRMLGSTPAWPYWS